MNAATLRRAFPNVSADKAESYAPLLSAAMSEAKITTSRRAAAFLAQVAHESAGLYYWEEIASGAAYEGRRDLGNTRAGDGRRYKGRGPIQLTGRSNYRAAGQALRVPLERNPGLAATPKVGFRIAAWFWRTRGLNELADRGDFREITRRINGGFNGWDDRVRWWGRMKGLGAAILPGDPRETSLRAELARIRQRVAGRWSEARFRYLRRRAEAIKTALKRKDRP